ncbi:hypothetical protein [Fibrivirga algicola]|uniref:Uncharacterized protein n=1 Tax=Fibrivirga algicola TaxID=2950420 RepID=A0ABX0QEW0_9BACT|nr:hypothetical protein [Fibrivirga algicola]NID09403.1 hypothetical protein [Fibrivirga algicola]
MTNPFASYVGLRGIATDVPVWVNDLPGMSTQLVNAVRKDDQSAAETWERINRLALTKLRSMLENEFNKTGEFQHTVAQTSVWKLKDTMIATLLEPFDWYGCRFTVPYSPYRQLVIQSLIVEIAEVGAFNLPVKIVDLNQKTVTEKTIARSGGRGPYSSLGNIKLPVDMYGLDVFVGIDASALSLKELGASANAMTGDSGVTMTTGALVPNTLDASGFAARSAFVWIAATVSHSLDSVIEGFAADLADCYNHILGSLLMADKRGSNRINLYTNTNLEFAREKEVEFIDEATVLLKPLARRIVTEINAAPASIVVPDPDDQPGYYPISLV